MTREQLIDLMYVLAVFVGGVGVWFLVYMALRGPQRPDGLELFATKGEGAKPNVRRKRA